MVCLWMFVAVVAGLIVLLVGWNVFRIRTGRIASAIPIEIREDVLHAIDRAGIEDGTRVLLLRLTKGALTDPFSKIGGIPLYPTGTTTQASDSRDIGDFLAQVRLRSPPLKKVWSNLIVMLFCDSPDAPGGVVACNGGYATSFDQSASRLPNEKERGIEMIALPPGDTLDNEQDDVLTSPPYGPRSLLRRVPALRELLANYPDAP